MSQNGLVIHSDFKCERDNKVFFLKLLKLKAEREDRWRVHYFNELLIPGSFRGVIVVRKLLSRVQLNFANRNSVKAILKMKHFKVLTITALGAASLASFQNCAPDGFKIQKDMLGSTSLASSISTAPQVSLVAPIPTLSNSRSLSIKLNVMTDAQSSLAAVSCRLDANEAVDCTNLQMTMTNLLDGDHSLKIMATDNKGSMSEQKIYNFRIDATAPVVNISQAPAALTGSTTAAITFSATDVTSPVDRVMCSRDGAAYAPCSSPLNLTGITVGAHDLKIIAYDAAQNASAVVTANWTVDLSAPILMITAKPNAFSNMTTADFSFAGTSGGVALSSYVCSLDSAAFAACTSPRMLTALGQGSHTFSVRGTNAVGTMSAPVTASWVVDSVAPSNPTIMSNITSPTLMTSANITFSSVDAGSMIQAYQCALDASAFAACTSPQALTGLTVGTHTIKVKSMDFAGNSSGESTYTWVINSATPPPVLDGKTLFANNCASCHNSPDFYVMGRSTKEDRTAVQISQAIATVSSMNSQTLRALTGVQLDAIAAYLKTPVPGAIACKTDFKPERAPVRLLAHGEYDNIAVDIFKSKKKPSVDAKFVMVSNGTSGFSNTSVTSEPTAPAISETTVEKYLTAAGIIADELIANKAEAGSGYSTLAACAVGQSTVTEACYDSIVRGIALKVWRRPVSEAATNNEFARLKVLLKTGSFDSGLKTFVKALLMSPNYLAVTFAPSTAVAGGTSFNLSNYQLATRLAFFLWASTPDDNLLAAAQGGTLLQAATLQAQVSRMLKDPKAKRFTNRLTNEWLGVNDILRLGITSIPAATLNAMVAETQFMFDDIVNSDVSFLNSIAADYSFLNKSLADYYGVGFPGVDTNMFYKTNMSATPRRGVVNHASFLIATAGATDQTHPVLRGKLISTRIGCYEIAPPPADLDISLPAQLPPDATPREVLAIHTQRAQCASCHNTLDPFGLPLETYDAKGMWRSTYALIKNRPVITSGTLPTGETFNNTPEFMSTLAASPSIRSCLVKKVMSAGLARRVASVDDNCIAGQISTASMTPQSKFSDLVMNIVNSRQFKMQTTEAP